MAEAIFGYGGSSVLYRVKTDVWLHDWGDSVTISCTSVLGYQSLTADNFIIELTQIYTTNGGGPYTDNILKSYDSSSGSLVISQSSQITGSSRFRFNVLCLPKAKLKYL